MIRIDTEKCIGCGQCVKDCLNRALKIEEGKAVVTKPCFLCGHCIAICPAEAVSMDDYDMADVIPFDQETCAIEPDRLLRFMKLRRSIRQFQKKPVEKEKLDLLLEAGRFAPTGSNAQNVSYIVIQDRMEEFRALSMEEFRKYRAPEAFPKLFPPPMTPDRVNFDDDDFLFKGGNTVILTVSPSAVNASIASSYMELLADALGLGMVYVGFFVRLAAVDEPLRTWLGLAPTDQVVTAMSIGYPDVNYLRSVPRKPLQTHWN